MLDLRNEHTYLNLLSDVLYLGDPHKDRTGVGTRRVFGTQMRFDLRLGFPLLTTKRMPFRHIAEELFWFLRGETNVKPLQEKGVSIWDEWANEDGDLGPIYGKQWRDFGGVDQIKWVVDQIRSTPNSRRLIVSAWNPVDVPSMALPPCHVLFQFNADGDWLDLSLYQRSGDMFLGVPFNIASYSLLLHLVAATVGMHPRHFIHTIGDAHVYDNHRDAAEKQLSRKPFSAPKLWVDCVRENVWEYSFDDIELSHYQPFPSISAPVAV
jgi:thymidylate synthase